MFKTFAALYHRPAITTTTPIRAIPAIAIITTTDGNRYCPPPVWRIRLNQPIVSSYFRLLTKHKRCVLLKSKHLLCLELNLTTKTTQINRRI